MCVFVCVCMCVCMCKCVCGQGCREKEMRQKEKWMENVDGGEGTKEGERNI